MKYGLDLIWKEALEVEASTREEALAKAKEAFPNHKVDYIIANDGSEGTGVDTCEGCGCAIFDDQEFAMDDDGNMLCADCKEAVLSDVNALCCLQ